MKQAGTAATTIFTYDADTSDADTSDAEGDAITDSLTQAPSGASIDGQTGIRTWTASVAGD